MRLPLEFSLGKAPEYPISFRAVWKREEMLLPNSAAIGAGSWSADAVHAPGPAWLLSVAGQDRATPPTLHREPTLPSDLGTTDDFHAFSNGGKRF
jgi:hypothetical protein